MLSLPPLDRESSPHTGWTRAHWLAVADTLLRSVRPFASPGHALVDLPGPASGSGRWSDGLEGFARTFLLAAFRLAGGTGEDLTELADWYALGVATGTDPRSPQRWPTLAEKGQAKVECASVALALHLTRPWIWDRFDDRVRHHVIDWLAGMIGTTTPNNNWIWFQNIAQAFLRSVGGPFRAEEIERNIARTEAWYVGDGWYSDGDAGPGGNRNFDYYNGWAMHFYPLWYCRISGADDTVYRERLARYLLDAQHLVGADGAPLCHGRSLTYRWAMLAPFWMGCLFDANPLPPGRTRRLASGVLSHFVRAGVPDRDGLLPLGWYHAFPAIRQAYSGPGSPYWASKGFAGIALSADHPVWTDVEQSLVVESSDVLLSLRGPGWLVSATRADGVVRMVNHGGDHARPGAHDDDDPCYDRFAYSSVCAPDLGQPDGAAPVDSHVALVADDGRPSLRRPYERVAIDGRVAMSRHRTHWVREHAEPVLGPTLTVASVARGEIEVRVVRIDDEPHRPLRLRIGGAALVPRDGLVSAVIPLVGEFETGVTHRRDANPFGRRSTCPWALSVGHVHALDVYVVAVRLGGAAQEPPTATVGTDGVVVTWPDGERDHVSVGGRA